MPTPEVPVKIEVRPDEFKVPESLKSEIQAIETNIKTNVQTDNQGSPVVTTGSTQSAKIQIPGDTTTLVAQAKGSITSALTWLAMFLLRMLKKKEAAGVPDTDANNDSE